MKKLLLLALITSSFSFAYSAERISPTKLTIINVDGNYLIGGAYPTGSKYADAMTNMIEQDSKKRQEGLSYNDPKVTKIIQEQRLNEARFIKLGKYADRAVYYAKKGMPINQAKEKAAAEILVATPFVDTYNPNDPSTSYNANSTTDSMIEGNKNTSIDNTNEMKQFNDLDCSYEEVSNYMDTSNNKKSKAFTLPNYSSTYKETAQKSTKDLKGEEEASCQTIFSDVDITKVQDFDYEGLMDKIPSIGGVLSQLGKESGKKIQELTSGATDELKKGLCKRLSSEYIGGKVGDIIDDQYSDAIDDSILSGTRLNNLDKQAGRENFTYKLIKNQTGLSNSNLIKALDITRKDNHEFFGKYVEKELDNSLDDLEDEIFG